MKKITILLIISLIIPVYAFAFNIKLINPNNEKVLYNIYWGDHNFKDHPFPIEMAGGELGPGEQSEIKGNYPGKHWAIIWRKSGEKKEFFYELPITEKTALDETIELIAPLFS